MSAKGTNCREYTPREVADALLQSRGLVTLAAKRLGCSRMTVYKHIKRSALVQEAVQEARETTTDMAEDALYNAIGQGESWAVCFYLKCIGKSRGYVERQEVTGADGGPIETKSDTAAILIAADTLRRGDGGAAGNSE